MCEFLCSMLGPSNYVLCAAVRLRLTVDESAVLAPSAGHTNWAFKARESLLIRMLTYASICQHMRAC